MTRRTRPSLVVLRALWLGDLLTVVPCLRALAEAFSGHRRLLAAPGVLAPLVEIADAGFEVIDAAPLAPLPGVCAGAEPAVNLHGRGPESHRVLLATRPATLVAFRHPGVPETAGAPAWDPEEHEVRRWCRLLDAHGIPADPARLRLRRPAASAPGWSGATVLHPGAKAVERRWPLERWAAVARAEIDSGRRVVVTGSASERSLAGRIAAHAGLPPDAVLAGRTGLAELAALVAHAGRVLSADTGIAHLATALGTPSVTLFGPEPPHRWGPLIDREIHSVIWKGPARPGDGHTPHPALVAVEPDEVLAAAESLPA